MDNRIQKNQPKPGMSIALIVGIVFLLVIGISAAGGAFAGQRERNAFATQTTEMNISVQFDLGLQNLDEGRYELALQRFLWVQERSPDYPGLAEVLSQAETLKAAAVEITSDGSPALDVSTRVEQLYSDSEARFAAQDWERVIDYLDELIELDPTYKEAEVKEMLFTALKTLGLGYIRGDRLEEGIYLLGRAEGIKTLDDVSKGEIYLANLYLTAKSYWNINWPIAISNLEAILEVAPNYRDAEDKLFEAHVLFGDQLMALRAFCDAEVQYTAALEIKGDTEVQAKLPQAHDYCLVPPPINSTGTPGIVTTQPTGAGTTPTRTPSSEATEPYTGIPTEAANIP